MTDNLQIRQLLISKTDLEWFDSMCDILRKESTPTTHKLADIIGPEKPNPRNEIRGSKFLDPYDKRFRWAGIDPNLSNDESDRPLDYLGFLGDTFTINIGDIAARFTTYRTSINIYDGGTQIFFYPVPLEFEFTAIALWTEKKEEDIDNVLNVNVNNINFRFGSNLVKGMDGYAMKRAI